MIIPIILSIIFLVVMLLLCINNLRSFIFLAVFLMPFQHAFTLQIGATIRISDVLFIIIFICIVIRIFYYRKNLVDIFMNSAHLYLVITLFGLLLSSTIFSEKISQGLATLPLEEANSKLIGYIINIILIIMITAVGYYITKYMNKTVFDRLIKIWSYILCYTSLYIIIQFVVLNLTGWWFKLPGEVLNVASTYAYGLRRPYGFFIEPGEAGRFLILSLLMVMIFKNKSKLKNVSIILGSIGILCTFSSIAIFTLLLIIIIQFFLNGNIKIKYKISIIFLFVLLTILILSNNFLYDATINKLVGDNYSKIDRLNNVSILFKMFNENYLFGVGYGNFGALRNLYGIGTEIPYKDFYDLSNNLPIGVLGEQGIIGITVLSILFINIYISLKKNGVLPWIFILPILMVFSTSGTIFFSYLMFSIGLILGMRKNQLGVI